MSDDDKAKLCTRQGDVEAARVAEETNRLGAHARKDNVVLLAALEGVDAGHLDLLIEFLAHAAGKLHVADDVGALPLVRRNDANLVGRHAGLEEPRDNLFAVARLGAAGGSGVSGQSGRTCAARTG